ncbi:2OG-Fe(II) oxygenase [Moritella viscosa]|uniref:Oxidoreductase, 2OG-Fe(II) oxygenase family n=1 Tax=Moritella viscosa TaxID=80854 RepID=A0A1L0BNP4_9GAMM|nr:2OG-Fe(II) oxygenase [Moritella viscosa]SGZ06790.1 Oxidoreductase, 2OG-Fe(II) oxygenase family [Moritella viscosa]SHO09536.1 Oxidoreductase, 2OG-Fe(II) oxygenase family [Moritella viscosa]SHO09585.1 Oxidoreductase, 2OG-Fe(II) oxygenase family [Moritella viscosa]SHO14462.1 Oxidoreductase, 2OG-Fe(II) oxygenase family [Moritella viscosa]SHO16996.1 Oxidoreductase, 2OG-Fe(II) oxygenase family [Moritella viscosa]
MMTEFPNTETKRAKTKSTDFFVTAYEPGAEHPALPTWASNKTNLASLSSVEDNKITRQEVSQVPGAFQLLNVFSKEECQRFIQVSESMGYLPDAAVSLPRDVRHNDSLTWVVDEQTDRIIWERIKHLMSDEQGIFGNKSAVGINARFRFYRYSKGDYFKPHSDGSWPGSRVINNKLIADAYGDRFSQMTFLILLTEDFDGGATRFLVNANNSSQPARRGDQVTEVDIRTPAGSVLCFPHGMHPLHCIHSSEPIYKGVKYIIRTDVLFEL